MRKILLEGLYGSEGWHRSRREGKRENVAVTKRDVFAKPHGEHAPVDASLCKKMIANSVEHCNEMIKRDETLSGHIGALQVKQMIINLDDESDDECEEEWAIVIIEEQNQREAERESQCEDERESQREDERERKQRLLEEGQVIESFLANHYGMVKRADEEGKSSIGQAGTDSEQHDNDKENANIHANK